MGTLLVPVHLKFLLSYRHLQIYVHTQYDMDELFRNIFVDFLWNCS